LKLGTKLPQSPNFDDVIKIDKGNSISLKGKPIDSFLNADQNLVVIKSYDENTLVKRNGGFNIYSNKGVKCSYVIRKA